MTATNWHDRNKLQEKLLKNETESKSEFSKENDITVGSFKKLNLYEPILVVDMMQQDSWVETKIRRVNKRKVPSLMSLFNVLA